MVIPLIAAGLVGALFGFRQGPRPVISEAEARALYDPARARPSQGRTVFHLGHSLVGRDMPAMLTQLADAGHVSHSQLGWGTSLKNHWEGEINGFAAENDHPAARPAQESIEGGSYDALVLTEMVDIRSAIRYHQSAEYLQRWTERAVAANPDTELYFYETWPHIDDPEGWFERVEHDLTRHWEQEILFPVVRSANRPIYVIPGGQALAATIRALSLNGGIDGVSAIEDFFALASDGSQDMIHINDLGIYVIAVTHYAVLYHADPRGIPYSLRRADGSAAEAPSAALAALIQQCVWDVVSGYPLTGMSPHNRSNVQS